MKSKRKVLAVVALAGVGALGACGGGEKAEKSEKNPDGTEKLAVKYAFEKPCVKPAEEQRFTATTEANAQVAMAVLYPHGFAETKAPAGHADGKGAFSGSWSVPADVPGGLVRVTVIGANGKKIFKEETTFKIADANGGCA